MNGKCKHNEQNVKDRNSRPKKSESLYIDRLTASFAFLRIVVYEINLFKPQQMHTDNMLILGHVLTLFFIIGIHYGCSFS